MSRSGGRSAKHVTKRQVRVYDPHCDPTRIGFWEIGSSLGCAGGEESSLGSLERFLSDASNGARVGWGFLGVLVLRARKVEVGV
eukprot:scaffold4580_cov128-Isochrysis_galbana.AAC.3